MSLTPADMDFAGMRGAAAREIATAFGVPPMLLGLPGDATYANYREANRALWRLAILPLAGTILAAVGAGECGGFPVAGGKAGDGGAWGRNWCRTWGRAWGRLGRKGMSGAVLAQLMAQTAEGGADLVALRAIAEEAGELGARWALSRLRLEDVALRRTWPSCASC